MKIKFFPSTVYIIVLLILLRITELIGIAVQIPPQEYFILTGLTLFGLATDLIFFAAFVLLINTLFRKKGIPKVLHYVGMFLFHALLFAHLVLLVYYIHQRIPLGIILYQHNFEEVYLTATNSGYSMKVLALLFLFTILFFAIIYWIISKKCRQELVLSNPRKARLALLIMVIYLIIELFNPLRNENYYVNNSKYFYTESTYYFWSKTHPIDLSRNEELIKTYQHAFPHRYIDKNHPLVHEIDTVNHLVPYFEPFTEKPNIVFLIVEGLNDDFIHEKSGLTLMPFLSSLKAKSLYWENCFTLGERSFAAVPSLLGSLIYGENGFMQLDAYPRFTSLANVLKANDYHVRFNYGQGAWFHSKDKFFKWQDVDVIFDKEVFDPTLPKMLVDDGYFWGYDDLTFLGEAIKNLDNYPKQPSLEVYFTGSMHAPYIIPNKDQYIQRFKSNIQKVTDIKYKAQLEAFATYYVTTQVTDDAIKQFIESYSKRAEFANTLFIITGDHPMTEAPVQNSLKRYHVPLLLYSPKLKKPATSKNVVSHLDVQQTIYNLLRPYTISTPNQSAALGKTLKIEGNETNRTIVFMNGHRFLEDIYCNGYYLSKNQLYQVKDHFQLEKTINYKQKSKLQNALNAFQWMSLYTTTKEHHLSAEDYTNGINKQLILHQKLNAIEGSTSEFIDLFQYKVQSINSTLELSYTNKSKDQAIRLVLTIDNQKGDQYFYQEFYNESGKNFKTKLDLKLKNQNDSIKLYVYNPSKTEVKIEGIEVLMYK